MRPPLCRHRTSVRYSGPPRISAGTSHRPTATSATASASASPPAHCRADGRSGPAQSGIDSATGSTWIRITGPLA